MARRKKRNKSRFPQTQNQTVASRREPSVEQDAQLLEMHAIYKGPLPTPQMLHDYEEAYPGTADRILTRFETEGKHRHLLENKITDAQIVQQGRDVLTSRLGQVFGLIIGIVGLSASAFVIYNATTTAQSTAGATIGTVSLATLVGTMVYGHKTPLPKDDEEPEAEAED
jgi:uncharacterized membrane protein